MRIYGLKNCDTVRKAMKSLAQAGYAPELVDLRAAGLSAEDFAPWLARFGAALVNQRSTTWRGLDEAERARPPEALLAAHPALMKRPLIIHDGQMTLGWTPQAQAVWLDNQA
ncbi:MAG TPA: arsenate reductase [Aliiroseovarius sp.]|nr:arsenate reductase [Aliiroseovarius sp.]